MTIAFTRILTAACLAGRQVKILVFVICVICLYLCISDNYFNEFIKS